MRIVCLDLEGVLVPEIWLAVAERTGITGLELTTRDVADYDELMGIRLALIRKHDLTLTQIQDVISTLEPLPGALEFLDALRARCQVVILSDTFYQFSGPLMAKLRWPTLFCHELEANARDELTGYRLRQADQKRQAVLALQSLNFEVSAAGDSYNDLGMLESAHRGFLFNPPPALRESHPQYPVTTTYDELLQALGYGLWATGFGDERSRPSMN